MTSRFRKPDREVKSIVLLVFLLVEAMFLFKNKFFFHFWGGLAGVKDFSFFEQVGVYGIKWEDLQHLEQEPVLIGVIIIFIALDVYLLAQIFR